MSLGSFPHRNHPEDNPGAIFFKVVNCHLDVTSRRSHLWEIDLRFAPGLPPGWVTGLYRTPSMSTGEESVNPAEAKLELLTLKPHPKAQTLDPEPSTLDPKP